MMYAVVERCPEQCGGGGILLPSPLLPPIPLYAVDGERARWGERITNLILPSTHQKQDGSRSPLQPFGLRVHHLSEYKYHSKFFYFFFLHSRLNDGASYNKPMLCNKISNTYEIPQHLILNHDKMIDKLTSIKQANLTYHSNSQFSSYTMLIQISIS